MFAAIVPIAGFGNPFMAHKLIHVAVWVFHNERDTCIPVEGSRRIAQELKRAGGTIKETYYPKDGHDAWTETYDNGEVYSWLLSQRRIK